MRRHGLAGYVRGWLLAAVVAAVGCGEDSAASGGGRTPTGGAPTSGSGGATSGSGGAGDRIQVEGGLCAMTPMPETLIEEVPLTRDEVADSLDAIRAFVDARPHGADTPADPADILAFVRTAPHIAEAGIAADCTVWASLADGTPLSIFVGRPPEPAESGAPPPARAQRPEPPPLELKGPPATFALPRSSKAVLSMSDGFSASIFPAVAAALEARGYEVVRRDSVRLTHLRGDVNNLGVLWHSSHGASCKNKYIPGKTDFCLSTDDEVVLISGECLATDCDSAEADRYRGLVSIMLRVPYEHGPARPTYGITPRFVETYWTFADNSLVVLDGCMSMSNLLIDLELSDTNNYAGAFRTSLKKQHAGTLVGWTNPVSGGFSTRTMHMFFDRILGANKQMPLMHGQRPFSVPEVYAMMAMKGLVTEPVPLNPAYPNAVLDVEQTTPDATILAPSIRNLVIGDPEVSPNESELATDTPLTIYGEFGTRDVSATIAAAPMAVTTPRSDKVVAKLSGPAAKGDVEVAVLVGGRLIKSNKVPLTSWKGACKFTAKLDGLFGGPGPETVLDCSTAHFRADIHAFRMNPEEMPLPGKAIGSGGFSTAIDFRSSVADSACKATASGTGDNFPITTTFQTQTFDINWKAMHLPDPGSPNPMYALSARLDATDPNAIRIGLIAAHKIYVTATIIASPAPPTDITNFTMSSAPVDFSAQPATLGADYAVHITPMEFSSVGGNHGKIECNLVPEAGTAPTATTDG